MVTYGHIGLAVRCTKWYNCTTHDVRTPKNTILLRFLRSRRAYLFPEQGLTQCVYYRPVKILLTSNVAPTACA